MEQETLPQNKSELNDLMNELRKMKIDINIIKGKLDEGELSDWAKQELSEARERKKKLSHEEVKQMIFTK